MEKKFRNRTKKSTKRMIESERSKEEEQHLSGAYIRSLVKHLTTAKPRQEDETPGTISPSSSTANLDPREPKQVIKKQVRRRQHTSKPYQERLLNMAEARKEIVTALKYHRASMRQAQAEANQRAFQDGTFCPGTANFTNYPGFVVPSSPLSQWINHPPLETTSTVLPINLPSETLGLNLNFHNLGSAELGFFVNNSSSNIGVDNPFGIPSYTPSLSSLAHDNTIGGAPTPSTPTNIATSGSPINLPNIITGRMPLSADSSGSKDGGASDLHQALDEEEMAEIRSLGLQHELEWNDTMNSVNSAWWFRFLNNMEVKDEGSALQGRGSGLCDEFMEIPSYVRQGGENQLEPTPMASSDDLYEDFLQDNSFEW